MGRKRKGSLTLGAGFTFTRFRAQYSIIHIVYIISVLDLVPYPSLFGDLRQVTLTLCMSLFLSINWSHILHLYIFFARLNSSERKNVCKVIVKSIRSYMHLIVCCYSEKILVHQFVVLRDMKTLQRSCFQWVFTLKMDILKRDKEMCINKYVRRVASSQNRLHSNLFSPHKLQEGGRETDFSVLSF